MSTILNSLKKSSNNRIKDSRSSIDNFNFSHQEKKSKLGLVVLFLFLIAFTVGSYYLISNYYPAFQNVSVNKDDVIELVASEDGGDVSNTNKISRPNADTVKSKLAEAKRKQQEKRQKELAEAAEKQRQQQALVTQEPPQKPQPPTTQPQEPIQIVVDNSPTKPAVVITKPTPKPKPAEPEQQYLLVHQLPFSIRKDLPRFKLNIHLYDEDPEKRIAIINGVQFYIDDMIEQAVLVKDIVKQGVILEVNNREFLIPR